MVNKDCYDFKNLFFYTVVMLIVLSSTMSRADAQASLQQCQYVRDKIKYYTDLKRAGGSASQMAFWHRKRNDYKAQFSDYHCTKYRNKLK